MTQPSMMTSIPTNSTSSNGKSTVPLPSDNAKSLSEKETGELIAWVKNRYDKMKTDRQKIRRRWDKNLQMYGGNQYTEEITGRTGISKVVTRPSPRSRERSTTNRVRPIIRTEITRLSSQKPSVTVVPGSAEDDDLFAAQAGEAVWEFLYQHNNLQWTMERNAFWTAVCGNGFVKTWWDAGYIDKNFKNALGMPAVGNIKFGVVTPYNLFIPDLLCEMLEDQPYVFEAYTKPVEWARMFYKQDFKPTIVSKTEIFESSYFQSDTAGNTEPDSVLVIEAYIKPGATQLLKRGGLITICGDKLVGYVEGMPYSHEEYPYAHTKHIMTGMFYADSVLTDINPLQREYNRTRNQIIESKNRTARPQILAPLGTMDVSKYTSEPGLIVQYKPALGKPEPLPVQAIPNYVLEELNRIISDMEDVSGQHQVSRGMAPGQGVVAATAIAYLQEKDESLIFTTMSSIEQMVTKIARHSLTLAADFWEIPRIIRVTGTDRAFDSVQYKGADIANGLDVRCEPGSALPMSKAARQAFLMDLFQSGAITAQQMLDMMEMGAVNTLVDRMRVDMRAAQRENLRMKRLTAPEVANHTLEWLQKAEQGAEGTFDPNTGNATIDPMNIATYPPMVPVNDWDNHPVHITTHNNYRKSQEFEMLDPVVKDQFDKHIKLHQTMAYMGMQNPMMGQAMGGMPNSSMGMTPEMMTGPDSSGMPPGMGTSPSPNGQAPQGQPQPM